MSIRLLMHTYIVFQIPLSLSLQLTCFMRSGECLLNRKKNKANNIEDGHVTRNMKNLCTSVEHIWKQMLGTLY